MKPASRNASWHEIRVLTGLVLGLGALLGSLFALNYLVLNKLGPGGEFHTLWSSGRGFLFDRIDPYGGVIPARVQELVYGRPAQVGEPPYILTVPFHLLLVFLPIAAIPDPSVARAVYMILMELALAASIFISLRLSAWRVHWTLKTLYVVGCVLSLYSYSVALEGSPSLLVAVVFMGAVWCFTVEKDEAAGALLVLGSFRWEMAGPIWLVLAAHSLGREHRRVWVGFVLLGVLLLAVSYFLYPGWLIPLWRAVINDQRALYGFRLTDVLARFGSTGAIAAVWLVRLIVVAVMVNAWRQGRTQGRRGITWAAFIILAATPLLGQRVQLQDLAVLLFVWPVVLKSISERWGRPGWLLAALIWLVLALLPWWISVRGREWLGLLPNEQLFLLLPVVSLIALQWMRWWALRAPRALVPSEDPA